MKQMRRRLGFTLVELLVVIGIISILAGLLLPALRKAIDSSRQIVCANNHKQMGYGLQFYTDDFDGWMVVSNDSSFGKDPRYWRVKLIPYIGITMPPVWYWSSVYKSGVFLCPSFELPSGVSSNWDGGYGWNFYYMGYNWTSTPGRQKLQDLPRPGESILIGDTADWWSFGSLQLAYLYSNLANGHPTPAPGNRHFDGINLLWGDFHVSRMSQAKLMTGDNGDVDWYYKKDK